MAQLMNPTVGISPSSPTLFQPQQQRVDVGSTLKYTDYTPMLYELGAKIAEGVFQYEVARESYVAMDAKNKRDLAQSQILDEMSNDPKEFTPERSDYYKQKINDAANEYQAVIDGLSDITAHAAELQSKEHSIEVTDKFYKISRKKTYDYEAKTIAASLTLETQKLYDLRDDDEKFEAQYKVVESAAKNWLTNMGLEEGSDQYKQQRLEFFSSALVGIAETYLGLDQLGKAKAFRRKYDAEFTSEDKSKIDVGIFNLEEKFRREAEAAANASGGGSSLDKLQKEQAALREKFLLGQLSELDQLRMIQERLIILAEKKYQQNKEQIDPAGVFTQEQKIALITPYEKNEVIIGFNKEYQANKEKLSYSNAVINSIAEFIASVRSQLKINRYASVDSIFRELANNGAIDPAKINLVYERYRSLSEEDRKRLEAIISQTPEQSNLNSLYQFSVMKDEQLITWIESQARPLEALTLSAQLNIDDARKILARYGSIKELQNDRKTTNYASTFASALIQPNKDGEINSYGLSLGEDFDTSAEVKIYEALMKEGVKQLFLETVSKEVANDKKQGKNTLPHQKAEFFIQHPNILLKMLNDDILALDKEIRAKVKKE